MHKKTDKGLHASNLHQERYDFEALCFSLPALKPFVQKNVYGDLSIDFSNAEAVLMLNRALLAHFYSVEKWQIPQGYLCPPIPGRVDYIHYIADLLRDSKGAQLQENDAVKGLDIGVGANCIYPIVGSSVYGWKFVGSDVDRVSVASAQKIVSENPSLCDAIEIRMQNNPEHIFTNIIAKKERFAFSMCNPPFHRSPEEASAGTQRKNRNLSKNRLQKRGLNFGGQANELWCEGGEVAFIKKMIMQSVVHSKKVLWFTTLVSKKESLSAIYKALKRVNPQRVETIEMRQGQKVTRIVAWSFLETKAHRAWFKAG